MQLRFEAAPFPAATVCNLNAFKYSELIQYEEIKEGFDYWERVINARHMSDMLRQENKLKKTYSTKLPNRRTRAARGCLSAGIRAVYVLEYGAVRP
ncbi:hypothetical protein ANCCAN_29118 [Ancylostoma caninum]|uniref:Uncharacterized protein n=1 Tax=Ancylostoma caninum TaxID=29170 RepID=A0A368EZC0_ANCCA|nr:hypothetical protein ANCCAN_29118 [Ancylostoma caninum]